MELDLKTASPHKLRICPCSALCQQLSVPAQGVLGEKMAELAERMQVIQRHQPNITNIALMAKIGKVGPGSKEIPTLMGVKKAVDTAEERDFLSRVIEAVDESRQHGGDLYIKGRVSSQKIGQGVNPAVDRLWKMISSPMKDPVFNALYNREQGSFGVVTGDIRRANNELIRINPRSRAW